MGAEPSSPEPRERLVLVARRRDRLEALAAELGEDPASVLVADLAAADGAQRVAAEVGRRGFEIHLLVNNAGVGHTARFHEQASDRIASMLDVNVRAVVDMTRAFLPAMVARGRGHVLNVASNAAFQPVPFLAVYAATKSPEPSSWKWPRRIPKAFSSIACRP